MPYIAKPSLICPLDQQPLSKTDGSWRCALGHSFDIAKQGHIHLLPVQHKNSREPGDSREMVDARRFFLNSGVYAPLAERLASFCDNSFQGQGSIAILDAGCGDGYYLNLICQQLERPGRQLCATGLDISKWAARACAGRYKHLTSLVASNRKIPLAAQSQDIVLCLFGFPVYREFARILKPGGLLLQVDPGPEHLIELRREIYPEVIRHPPPSAEAALLEIGPQIFEQALQFQSPVLNEDQRRQLLLMTPHFHRASEQAKARLQQTSELRVSIDTLIRVFKRETS